MIERYADQYLSALLQDVLPFWISHSIDDQSGGFFTCLDRYGNIYDQDKYVWLQARQVWTFIMLYDELENNEQWLNIAVKGARFLEQFGRHSSGAWYFSLDRNGQPLIRPYNIFSDCFACMAFSRLYHVTKEENYASIASETFANIIRRQENPKGIYNKVVSGTRPSINFALPMILSNLSLEMGSLISEKELTQSINVCREMVMHLFYDSQSGLILENVTPSGDLLNTFDGRLINPGHAIEAMWFMMDIGIKMNDSPLIRTACDRILRMLEYGWDETHGGIFYFLDRLDVPPQQLEWDQKLWWVHLETLIALAKGYKFTGDDSCTQWFDKVHDYTWSHFPDKEGGEWYGYLKRDGQPLLPLKGGKWKGCFHVPRGLWQIYKTLNS